MKKKRRRFSTQFKLKVILEALSERQSVSELAQKHNLHPNQISKWKSDFIENASQYMIPKEGKSLLAPYKTGTRFLKIREY